MTHYLQVKCLTNRFWDPATKDWGGTEEIGTLVDISTRSDEGNPARLIPVAIVILANGQFEAVPTEFVAMHADLDA